MAVYVVIASTNPDAVRDAVIDKYGASFFPVAENVWMVSDVGSSKAVADKIGLTDGVVGSEGVVLGVSSYFGYARSDTWTWLQQYPTAVPNG